MYLLQAESQNEVDFSFVSYFSARIGNSSKSIQQAHLEKEQIYLSN